MARPYRVTRLRPSTKPRAHILTKKLLPTKPRAQIQTKEPRSLAQRCEELAIELDKQAGKETPWLLPKLPTSHDSPIGYYEFASEPDRLIAQEHKCNTMADVCKLGPRKQKTVDLSIRFVSPVEEADPEGGGERVVVAWRKDRSIKLQELLPTLESYPLRTEETPPGDDAACLIKYAPHLLHGVTLLILLTLLPANEIIALAVSRNVEFTPETLHMRKRAAINELPLYQWEQFLGLREGDFDGLADALRQQDTSPLIEDGDEKGRSKVVKKGKKSGNGGGF
ncbi:uncharacterized protein BDZ99DRAFT_257898 [Mytilinidion resinicola]|uniref:Uncharacterized protein n=1 Tax=Mytilinidion resinicola TaxID=574789 RepID=A0A6A6YZZ8_9PEZI|nr:uncharacterized protein BDZ99DRAFT_257898 [Mytilinidion resinicola]KAF2813505.1 hypothetical protein BDZ99DRAFT_257898 [Mytilinidion resinicola]